jgi:phosphoribosylformimino-5-aminoimidazole carboxamide ribotide isomerase
MQIIPAIDIIDGKCVRLTQGDYAQKKEYNSNPVEVARMFEDAGLKRLHLVDLDGAKQKRIINLSVLDRIASATNLAIDFGGGIQSNEDIALAFDAGASQVTAGSVAVKNPELVAYWLQHYGPEKIILGADARNEQIAISGWEEQTGVSIYEFLGTWIDQGVRYTVSTDVAKDGLLQGPSLELYQNIQGVFPALNIVASGGVSCIEDVIALKEMNIYGVIIGKAIYENKITLAQLSELL